MARDIGSRALTGGHNLTVVGKDSESAQAVAADISDDGSVKTAVTGEPLEGDVVVLAVYYPDARAAVEQHADQLAGKVVVDITNPVDENLDGLAWPKRVPRCHPSRRSPGARGRARGAACRLSPAAARMGVRRLANRC
jgi:hypothetical protein